MLSAGEVCDSVASAVHRCWLEATLGFVSLPSVCDSPQSRDAVRVLHAVSASGEPQWWSCQWMTLCPLQH